MQRSLLVSRARGWYHEVAGDRLDCARLIGNIAFPVWVRRRRLLMLKLYLDDGGHEDNTVVFTVAGYLAGEAEWTALEYLWKEALDQYGIPYFHMSECLAGGGHFKGWSPQKRDMMIRRLTRIINRHIYCGVARSVAVPDFREEIHPNVDLFTAGMPMRYRPITFCLHVTLEHIAGRLHTEHVTPEEQIPIVFEKGTKGLGSTIEYINAITSRAQWGQIFGSIIPGTKAIPGLQAADILANEAYRLALLQYRRGTPPKKPGRRMKQLLGERRAISIKYAGQKSLRRITEKLRDLQQSEEGNYIAEHK